jgi:undecaprenyl-diphosphatase
MNAFDFTIVQFLNTFSHRSWALDSFLLLLSENFLLKGAVITILYWWAWFRKGEHKSEERSFLLFGILSSYPALLISRFFSFMLPFRERPLRNPALHFQLPYGVRPEGLIGWSSFPSDNAVFFLILVTCRFFVSRRAGLFGLFHSVLVVGIVRVYLGYHYPTDILGGALIGIAVAGLSKEAAIRAAVTRRPLLWLEIRPDLSYAGLFLLSFLVATTFAPVIEMVRYLYAVTAQVLRVLQH